MTMKWPFVFSIPHSGTKVPDSVQALMQLNREEIMESVDVGTNEIFGTMPARYVVKASWNRLVADVNRAPSDTRENGVVAITDYHGRSVYRENVQINSELICSRIRDYYLPYHQDLKNAIALPGVLGLFDCHSLEPIGPPCAPDAGQKRADIVLGNNGPPNTVDGPDITCPPIVLTDMVDILNGEGFSVALNFPYSGGYITTHYGQILRKKGGFAVQIELNQGLYMKRDDKGPDTRLLEIVRNKLTRVFGRLAERLG